MENTELLNTNSGEFEEISAESFQFVQKDEKIHDLKFETKPVGFLKDALYRFTKNKASIVAACVLLVLVIYAIVGPFITKYDTSYSDAHFKFCAPKSELFAWAGWDGIQTQELSKNNYKLYSEAYPAGTILSAEYNEETGKYVCQVDTYKKESGYFILSFPAADSTGTIPQTLKDLIAADLTATSINDENWFSEDKIIAPYAAAADIIDVRTRGYQANVYKTAVINGIAENQLFYAPKTDYTYNNAEAESYGIVNTNTTTNEASNYALAYYNAVNNVYYVRVNYYNYATYINGFEPQFLFGSNISGQDLFGRLSIAARFSLLLGLVVASINICIGLLVGSIEGYYGGTVDLVIERIIEILVSIPSTVTASLFTFYIGSDHKLLALIYVFILTGWTGIASTVRSQFYRYKGQEYVLAARTLGAKDRRIIFRHILPNAIGPIVTQAVLMVPSVIFTESSLAYLGIISLNSDNLTSVGWLLNEAQANFTEHPFVLLFPAGFVAILMIAFNIFGNGLRDAFNPSLRGSE